MELTGTNAESFNLSGSGNSVGLGETLTAYSIQPKEILDVGTHSANVKVTYYTNAAHTTETSISLPVTFTVTARSVALRAEDIILNKETLDFTYKQLKPTVTVKLPNGITIPANEYTVSYANNTAVGTDTATITIVDKEGGNFTVNGSRTFSIAYMATEATAVLSGTKKNASSWYTDTVTLTAPAGYEIAQTYSSDTIGWGSSFTMDETGKNSITYSLKDTATGGISAPKQVTVWIDKEGPKATITVEENQWKTFIDTITFGKYYATTKDATITVTDDLTNTSDISISYLIATAAISSGDISSQNGWQNYTDAFSIQEEKNIVYVKVIDEAGNTEYYSSDGMVLDTQKPIISGIIQNQKYCGAITLTVADQTIEDTILTVDEVPVIFTSTSPAYTYTIPEEIGTDKVTHTIYATDKLGNESISYTIVGQKAHTYKTVITKQASAATTGLKTFTCSHCGHVYTEVIPVKGLTAVNQTSETDLKKFIEEAKTTINDPDTSQETKNTLEPMVTEAKNLLKPMMEAKAETYLNELSTQTANLPEDTLLTSTHKSKIDKMITDIGNYLAENDEYISEEKKLALNDKMSSLTDKKAILTEVEEKLTETENAINVVPALTNVKPGDNTAIQEAIVKIDDLLTTKPGNLTQAEKDALNSSRKTLENKGKRISDIVSKVSTIQAENGQLPASAPLTATQGNQAASLLRDTRDLLGNYAGNLTDAQKTSLEEIQSTLITKTADSVFEISTVVQGSGSLTATPVSGKPGTEIVLTQSAAGGYHFVRFVASDASVTITDSKFNMPIGNVTITAVFEKNSSGGSSGSEENPVVTPTPTKAPVKVEPTPAAVTTDEKKPVTTPTPAVDKSQREEPDLSKLSPIEYEESKEAPIEEPVKIAIGEGNVIVYVESLTEEEQTEGDVITGVVLSSIDNVIQSVLTKEEQEIIASGEDVEIRLVVLKLQSKVPEESKSAMEEAVKQHAQDNASDTEGMTIGGYIDLSLEKRVGNGDWERLKTLNEELIITIDIPEEMRNKDAKYWVIKDHEGNVTILEDLDDDPNTVTIRTKEFSTYAIAFSIAQEAKDNAEITEELTEQKDSNLTADTATGESGEQKGEKTTGNNATGWLWFILIAILVLGAGGYVWYQKKRNK